MKILTLNAWGGRLHEPLISFFKKYASDIDVFCLQEVFSSEEEHGFSGDAKADLYQDICAAVPGHVGYYAPKSRGYDYSGYVDKHIEFGNAVFVNKGLEVLAHDELFERVFHPDHDWKKSAIAKAQILTIKTATGPLNICNFHGLWVKDTAKKDIPERLEQSRHLKAVLNNLEGEQILCGDFNLVPDGQSIKLLEEGMRNLITEFGITSTRSSVYTGAIKYADYIFTTPGLQINSCVVLPEEVSDHMAVCANIEI